MARGNCESRNKKKGKFKKKKENPYKVGGKYRSTEISEGKAKK